MDTSTKSHITLNTLEKGLRSRALHEQMATIVNMTTFLRENPFPFFVNAAVLRLCEAFRDECNELRLCIVRVMGECSTELRLVFSSDEVARRVLKVSHSNDPLARSLTLQMLAKLARVVAENKQVHHLIVTSIDSEEAQERSAAVVATKALVAVSRSFSQTIFEKLCVTFLSPLASPAMKISLVGVFANMQADVEIIMKVFALGERILNEACNQQLMLALIKSLTTLAVSCRFAVSELLTLLIERLKVSKDNRTLCITILSNIKRLSSAAHMLTAPHMHDLWCFGDTLTDDVVRGYWLATLVCFTSQNVHKITSALDNILHWTYLLSNQNASIRLTAAHLYINVYRYSQEPNIVTALKSSFITSLPIIRPQDSERFYRLLTAFVCDDTCLRETVIAVTDAVLNTAIQDFSALHMLQFLVAAAEAHSYLYPRLCAWSRSKLKENTILTRLTLFSCLVYAPLSELADLPENHMDCWGDDPWVMYLVARSSMRNGHWKLVALPILDIIHKKAKSFQTRMWLTALRDICCAAISEFTVSALEESVANLTSARLSLSALCSSRETQRYFIFPLRFVECLCSMYAALRSFLVVANTNLLIGDGPPPCIMKKVSIRLQACAAEMDSCREMWSDLYRHCFDADDNTVAAVELYGVMCGLFSAALQMFAKQQPLSPLSISSSSHYSLANKLLRSSILWAKGEIEKLDTVALEKRLTKEKLKLVVDTFKHLCCLPMCLPRFFFQQLKHTQIKLNVLPQPGPTESAINVSSSQKVPISIEGAIESSRGFSFDAVIVKAVAKFAKGSNKDCSQLQTVVPQEGKFFNAQFLLAFPQSCTMEFSVNFLDKETKRLWESGVSAELKIYVSS